MATKKIEQAQEVEQPQATQPEQPSEEAEWQAAQPINTTVFEQERGGIAWTEVWGKAKDEAGALHLVKINLTQRGNDATEALRGLLAALHVAKEEFRLTPYNPTIQGTPVESPAPTQAPAVPVAPAAPINMSAPGIIPPPAPVAPPAPAAPAVPAATGPQIMKVIRVEVKPRTDGKVTVDLFGEGRKYPDLHMTNTPAALAAAFGGAWQAAHFAAIATYNVNLQVTWKDSTRLNQNGTPYKDVISIQ